ncbi:hypothetical protein GCM10009096_30470 [Parasphingorhabdus litoris]|uniref:Glycerophosphoryl diester phosphodiesterase membrane domain-containing protein n=1 Tax=Parasphingorhabdus litoris TaxID=394733 RepID=A0ABN1AYP4_9SPHN|nr:hypothetical protein [Parasphingorhabdus litoris]
MTFDIGRVMTATFTVISRHPIVFLGLSLLIAGMPYGLMQFFALNPDGLAALFLDEMFADIESYWLTFAFAGTGMFIVYFTLTILLQAMLIVATIRDMRNQHVDIGLCFAEAMKRFLPLIGLAILSLLGIILGLFLFIVPGVILFLMWMVAAPVMVVENRGIMDSLKRSAELASGSKGMMFLLMIIFMIASGMLSGMAEGLGFFNSIASVFVTIIAETAIAAVQAAGVAALYVELRTVKEGPFTDTLSDIFA